MTFSEIKYFIYVKSFIYLENIINNKKQFRCHHVNNIIYVNIYPTSMQKKCALFTILIKNYITV